MITLRLSKLGKQRDIHYDGHDMTTLLQITRDSGCIFSLVSVEGNVISAAKKDWSGIRVLQCPSELNMTNLPVALLGLSYRESEPAIRWLAKEISDSFKSGL